MKKLFLFVLFGFVFKFGHAGDIPKIDYVAPIGPSYTTAVVEISSGGTRTRNCLTYVVVNSTITRRTFSIFDGSLNNGTTIFSVIGSSSTIVGPFSKDEAICGSLNRVMYLNTRPAGTFRINYKGYTREAP